MNARWSVMRWQTDWQSQRIWGNGWLRFYPRLSAKKQSLRFTRQQIRQVRQRRIRIRQQFHERC